jgi:hypothetical protein
MPTNKATTRVRSYMTAAPRTIGPLRMLSEAHELMLVLSPADLARIEEAIPPSAVAGTRYDEHQMRILDSER